MLGRQDLSQLSWLQLERAIRQAHQAIQTLNNLAGPLYFVSPMVANALGHWLHELVDERLQQAVTMTVMMTLICTWLYDW